MTDISNYTKLTTEQYISFFPNNWYFSKIEPPDNSPPKYDSAVYNEKKLRDLNDKQHCAIWATINSFEGARKEENVTKLNGCYVDLDVGKDGDGATDQEMDIRKEKALTALLALPVQPNIITITRNGLQPIWLIDEPSVSEDTRKLFVHINKGIIEWTRDFGGLGDGCSDIPRILRIPGYYHLKSEPFLIESILIHETKTTLSVLDQQFPFEDYKTIEAENAELPRELKNIDEIDIREVVLKALREWGEPEATFDPTGRITISRGVTGAFQGKRGDKQYIASSSHDIPSGNKITFVRRLLGMQNNREAYMWVKEKFSLRTDIGEKTKNKGEKVVQTSYYEAEDYILEEIKYPVSDKKAADRANSANQYARGHLSLKFIKYSKLNDNLSIVDEEKIGDVVIRPIVNDLARRGIINLPEINVCPTSEEFAKYAEFAPLVADIKSFFDKFFVVPEFEKNFLPFYVLFTWVYEKFDFVPYLQFCGLTGTGKTRTGETVAAICYKSIDVRGSASIAAIFRMADEWKGTLFIDEFDMDAFGRDNYGAALAFLKSGVGDGSVIRVEGVNKREVVAYSVKSPKVFTSERPINDAGLQSRTYVIEMESSKKRLPLFKIKDKYNAELNSLRIRLLCWRLKNLAKIDLSKIEYGFKELEAFDKRVQQVITPIYYLADEKSKESVLKFAKEQEESTYNERREATAGIVFDVIKSLDDDYPDFASVRENVNQRLESDGLKPITAKALGKILKISLHFETQKVGHDHTTRINWTHDKFEAMQEYYGYGSEVERQIAELESENNDKLKDQSTDL